MQPRKSKKADLERIRGLLFLAGLVVSLSAVLLAFAWKTDVKPAEVFGPIVAEVSDDLFIPPTKAPETPKPPVMKEISDFILVDNSTEIIDEIDFLSTEVTPETVFDLSNLPITKLPDEKGEEIPVVDFAEEMPEFPGGERALLNFIGQSVKYPVIAQENGVFGKVYVTFIVDVDGTITNAQVTRGDDPSLKTEALRVVNSMPKWKPGKQSGKNVKVRFTVPINFILK